jgi:hypothetical protein
VDGTGFTSGQVIAVSFLQDATSKRVNVAADDAGAFHHVEDHVVQDARGGLVIAREEAGGLATARLRTSFPVVTSPPP